MEPEANPKPENRRRQYWIDRAFQKRVIVNLVLLVLGTLATAHLVALGYMKVTQSSPMRSATAGAMPVMDWAAALNALWIPLLITAVLAILFVLGFGLFYSHRIAGPLFNLKRMMQKVEHGELEIAMHIRTTDEFHDVETAFNQMVKGLKQRQAELRKLVENLPEAERKKILRRMDELFSMNYEIKEWELI